MKILAFDTSSIACSVAIQKNNNIHCLHEIAPMQQGRRILPMIHSLLDSCSLTLNQLDAIAYGCGPGSFTGIRMANSIVQGLGLVTKLPVISISSLAAIAQAAYIEKQWSHLFVAVDAHSEQIYWAIYSANALGSVELTGQEQICAPEKAALPPSEMNQVDWYGVGNGWEKYQLQLSKFQPKDILPTQLPTAQALLILAKKKFELGDFGHAANANPMYLR